AYIAMVLAQDTDYILLDEPLNNLDMKHSVEIMKILRRLVSELGKTIAIVIHDINFASCYSDFIVALKDGIKVEDDHAGNIIEKNKLENLYDMDFDIQELNNMKLCVYY
ncbi:MAG: iron ABC transporter ATP-binding protein, partial [Tissierellia bacterium]|nr:iron ABC transporter ATP-binding protein [Tissierellia bacterium]